MKRFAIIDKTNGNVDSTMGWGDERDLPSNYPLGSNQEVIQYDDVNENVTGGNACYNPNTKAFSTNIQATADVNQISHVDGVANITITYPENTVNEVCHIILDGQSVDVNVVNGTVTFPFTNQVVGAHLLTFISSSFYGKNFLTVEVV